MLQFGKTVILCKTGNTNPLQLSHLSFTNAGLELTKVLKPEKDDKYIGEIVESLRNKGIETRVSPSNQIIAFT
jgi:hypothetical protein